MVLVQVRRRQNKPTENKKRITVLHVAATITFTALLVALFMYFSQRSGLANSINKTKLKPVNIAEEIPSESFKQKEKEAINPESECSEND